MKHIKKFNEARGGRNFVSKETNYENDEKMSVEKLCQKWHIKNYKINLDGSINVDSDINFFNKNLNKIPIKFNRVSGHFICSQNRLETLENCPIYVKEDFECSYNNLKTLVRGPEYVGGYYHCSDNDLKDVYGFPETFNGPLYIDNNPVSEIINLALTSFSVLSSSQLYIRFIHLLNDYHVIRNGDTIIQDRLEEALIGMGIEKLNFFSRNMGVVSRLLHPISTLFSGNISSDTWGKYDLSTQLYHYFGGKKSISKAIGGKFNYKLI